MVPRGNSFDMAMNLSGVSPSGKSSSGIELACAHSDSDEHQDVLGVHDALCAMSVVC